MSRIIPLRAKNELLKFGVYSLNSLDMGFLIKMFFTYER